LTADGDGEGVLEGVLDPDGVPCGVPVVDAVPLRVAEGDPVVELVGVGVSEDVAPVDSVAVADAEGVALGVMVVGDSMMDRYVPPSVLLNTARPLLSHTRASTLKA
jgi:hypothetical protein